MNDPSDEDSSTEDDKIILDNKDDIKLKPIEPEIIKKQYFKTPLVWRNIIAFAYLHTAALYGLYLCIFEARGLTVAFGEYKIFFKNSIFEKF